jgi:REP element-mobilizing transposase RayT
MSRPRPVLPGQCYLVTRRCSERRFFLRPDAYVTNAYWYCLGWAAQKWNVGIVAALAMSNHAHEVIVDPEGNYPHFIRDFHALLARCLNAHRGRWEAFWTGDQTSMVRLVDEESQLDKLVYVLANPVQDHLVEKAHHWPGATALGAILGGRPITALRPRQFFRNDESGGDMPEVITIHFIPPPALRDIPQPQFADLVANRVETREREAAAVRATEGGWIVGRKSILRQHWNDRPGVKELRRNLSPRVATKDKWRRIEAIIRNRDFEARYDKARIASVSGAPMAFPWGTWAMRVFFGALVEPG